MDNKENIEKSSIYGKYKPYLCEIEKDFSQRIIEINEKHKEEKGYKLFEHFISRVKDEDSMIAKCDKKNLPYTTHSALKNIKDAIGLRIICGFIDDIYVMVNKIKQMKNITVKEEKDYIINVKPNGYRSYHMILEIETEFEDCLDNENGKYFIELQLRTIAMDSWASLEHQMKYKQDIKNSERLVKELKRCADELASCDLSMQTIRDLIRGE